MTLKYNANLVSEGAIKDSEGNKITTTYAKSADLATVATTGDYDDLTNKPTIPAAQVQADWSQSDNTAVDYIKNKPTIPSGVIVDQTYDGTSTNAQSGVAIEVELTTNYQNKLVSGTNIKTINNTSLLGSENIDTSEVFVATYGTTTYQDVLTAYNAGKTIICQYESNITSSLKIIYNLYLINFATNTTFNFSGTISGTAQYFYTNLTSSGWASVSDKTCETTSNKVTSLSSSNTNTQYPSAKAVFELLKTIYPVGSVYLSTNSTCPMANLFGTWTLVSSGKALWTGDGTNGDTTIAAGLPNITGNVGSWQFTSQGNKCTDCFEIISYSKSTYGGGSAQENSRGASFDASRVSSIYSNDVTTVQPPAYVVNVWKRTA